MNEWFFVLTFMSKLGMATFSYPVTSLAECEAFAARYFTQHSSIHLVSNETLKVDQARFSCQQEEVMVYPKAFYIKGKDGERSTDQYLISRAN